MVISIGAGESGGCDWPACWPSAGDLSTLLSGWCGAESPATGGCSPSSAPSARRRRTGFPRHQVPAGRPRADFLQPPLCRGDARACRIAGRHAVHRAVSALRLECVAGAALIACAAFVSGGALGGAWLAQLSFIGFAGFRLLPAFQQMYNAIVMVRANRPAIERLAAELAVGRPLVTRSSRRAGQPALRAAVELVDVIVSLRARFAARPGQRVAAHRRWRGDWHRWRERLRQDDAGRSACSGCSLPRAAASKVDGEPLDPRPGCRPGSSGIGYVPQDVMILDASVRENIAFGDRSRQRSTTRGCATVARQAGASEFIEALPGGYAARISGRGRGAERRPTPADRASRARSTASPRCWCSTRRPILSMPTPSARSSTPLVRNRGSRTMLIVAHGAAVIDACDRVFELRRRADVCASAVARAGDVATARAGAMAETGWNMPPAAPRPPFWALAPNGVHARARVVALRAGASACLRSALSARRCHVPARQSPAEEADPAIVATGRESAADVARRERTQTRRRRLPRADAAPGQHHRGDLVRRPERCMRHAGIECRVLPPDTSTREINAGVRGIPAERVHRHGIAARLAASSSICRSSSATSTSGVPADARVACVLAHRMCRADAPRRRRTSGAGACDGAGSRPTRTSRSSSRSFTSASRTTRTGRPSTTWRFPRPATPSPTIRCRRQTLTTTSWRPR